MKAYKVCYRKGNRFYSAWLSLCSNDQFNFKSFILNYQLNKRTKAIRGSLGCFCFRSLEHAEIWARNGLGILATTILEVEGHGKPRYPIKIPSSYYYDLPNYMTKLLSTPSNKRRQLIPKHLTTAPYDTVTFASVTPKKVIK